MRDLSLQDIDLTTLNGKLLWAALIEFTTVHYPNMTPFDFLDHLADLYEKCRQDGMEPLSVKEYTGPSSEPRV